MCNNKFLSVIINIINEVFFFKKQIMNWMLFQNVVPNVVPNIVSTVVPEYYSQWIRTAAHYLLSEQYD